jgi:hypothetical protein
MNNIIVIFVIKASLWDVIRKKCGRNWGCYYFLCEKNNPVNN